MEHVRLSVKHLVLSSLFIKTFKRLKRFPNTFLRYPLC